MVLLRLEKLRQVRRQAAHTQRQLRGTFRDGCVIDIDEAYSPALVNVEVYGRAGQTVKLPAQLTGEYLDLSPRLLAARLVGREVLLLAPTGRPAERLLVAGLKSTLALLNNTENDVTGFREQAARVLFPDLEAFTVELSTDRADRDRTLRVRTVTMALAGTPSRCRVRLNLSSNGVTQAYESSQVYTSAAGQEVDYRGAGDTLPTVTVLPLAGATPFYLNVPAGGSLSLSLESDIEGTSNALEGAYLVATSTGGRERSNGLSFASTGALPLLRVHGALR